MAEGKKLDLEELRKSFPALDEHSVSKLLGGGHNPDGWTPSPIGDDTYNMPDLPPVDIYPNGSGSGSSSGGSHGGPMGGGGGGSGGSGSSYFGDWDWGDDYDDFGGGEGWGDYDDGTDSNPGGSGGGSEQNSSGNPGNEQDDGYTTFPSFSILWANYPPPINGQPAHPSQDNYPNQCAIRVGYALIHSGVDLTSYPSINITSEGYPRSSKGLADWLWQNFGQPIIISQSEFESLYWDGTGIIYIKPPPGGIGHIDLFNSGYTGSGYYLGVEIWFWPIE